MPCRIPSSPPPLLIFLLFLLSLLISTNAYPGNNPPTRFCPNWTCGKQDITYPFWLASNLSSIPSTYCGYPGFVLICQDDTPILSLGHNNYTVTDIDYHNQHISLADTDVLADGTCPRPRHNLTLMATLFLNYNTSDIFFLNYTSNLNCTPNLNYTSLDTDLTFFLDCPDGPPDRRITCLSGSSSNRSYIITDDDLSAINEYDLVLQCQDIVVVPVLSQEVNRGNLSALASDFGGVLKKGFQLGWSVETLEVCYRCELSGGRCGYRTTNTSLSLACFCSNGVTDGHCGSKKQTKTIIIAGVSAGAGVVLIAGVLCVLWFRYKKRKQHSPSSKDLIRNSSFEASSKDPELGSIHYQTHVFTYEELQEATNHFDSSKELGDGGFGTVYKGKLRDGRVVAVKRLYENNFKRVEQFMNEIAILSGLRHQNLVSLYGCTSRRSRELLLVYEFVPNGTVADHLHGPRASERSLTWPMRLSIAIETADALAYLHAVEPPIIHRDVKTNNILLDGSFHVKVADFGLSRLFPTDATHVSTAPQGTPGYLDPEYHQCYQLTDRSDVYSFGVVLVELISSKPAVDITRRRHEINLASMAINKIQNCQLDELVDPDLGYQSDWATKKMITMVVELAFRCLQSDGEMRPPIREVLEVLTEIESEGRKTEKEGATDARDDAGLLKNIAPFSPDSVTAKWVSKSTTPNTSE
ncbi:LEAF RUST 10 DISEASE-RESISTANCE LOCUS RECEPTOR-LIKE PROTEIN KINASE-like 1.2 isoform X1 [Phoenix dactylifera]|uniref:non-specific serine/threonine protein kinase n=1 Tax=Phoenix dactylifera TaxID=42345 RepID=A0A8B7MVU7_PHODC|nr:LEAF RUST 10 DISEASE-RESISTANCE LOCUS RECEPTOR-LIKE PROTEIN KINASE-like 1.2 isoform X1 [Phoenix dactylifera]